MAGAHSHISKHQTPHIKCKQVESWACH